MRVCEWCKESLFRIPEPFAVVVVMKMKMNEYHFSQDETQITLFSRVEADATSLCGTR
jgi:hypothetical protein